jgi:hypothetical protein
MSYRRAIGLTAFTAVLATWPIAIYLSRQRVWTEDTLWIVDVMGISCLAFLAGCAIVLRSWIIGGMLIGLCVGALLGSGLAAVGGTIIGFSIGGTIDSEKTARKAKP